MSTAKKPSKIAKTKGARSVSTPEDAFTSVLTKDLLKYKKAYNELQGLRRKGRIIGPGEMVVTEEFFKNYWEIEVALQERDKQIEDVERALGARYRAHEDTKDALRLAEAERLTAEKKLQAGLDLGAAASVFLSFSVIFFLLFQATLG
jgi:hypothetical protein